MAFKYEDIMAAQYEYIAEQHAQAAAELEHARIAEDTIAVSNAADRILQLDQTRAALDARARSFVASQQQMQQGNRHGLSMDEQEIAHGLRSGDPSLSDDQREQIYAQNKQRYQHMRATGQYRDDQGTVRR